MVLKYFDHQNGIPDIYRNQCYAIASRLNFLINNNRTFDDYNQLAAECTKIQISHMGSGAHELYGTIKTIVIDWGGG